MNRPNRLPGRPDSAITSVMALRRAVEVNLALGARVISTALLCAACSATKTEPSGPAAPDAARSDADASSPSETHRTDAGRTHGTGETSSLMSTSSETLQSIDDLGTRPDAAQPQTIESDAAQPQTTQSDATRSDTTGLGSNPDGGGACSVELDESIAEHACFHISYGPFSAVAAASHTAVAELRETHTTYVVTLPEATEPSVVGLRMPRTGLYAMFSDVALPLVVNDGPNVVTPAHAQPVRGCDGFAEVAVYALETGRQYTLRLGPGATQVQLVFEQTYPDALHETCSEQTDVSRDSGTTSGGETSSIEAASTAHTATSDWTADASNSTTETIAEATSAAMSSDAGTCGALKSACLTADECCSGRCYARECVALECRTSGYCQRDDECCSYCHFGDSPHCH